MDERPPGPTGWFTVAVTCSADATEVLADVLWQAGPPAVEERAAGAADLVVLLAGYPDQATADGVAAALVALGGTGIVSVTVTPVTDDGLDGWRPHARITTAGPFTLVPAWLDHPAEDGALVVRLDPGPTFGSGSHPTTQLVLAAAAHLVRPGHRVLDVGCGSGVLAVAAALLEAEVVGIDVDPAAPAATTANALANGVADRVRFDHRALADLADDARRSGARFDVVLANLLSPIVVELAADLVEVVAPGGHLVVSGLLATRQQPAIDALTATGSIDPVSGTELDGWVAVTFQRRSP